MALSVCRPCCRACLCWVGEACGSAAIKCRFRLVVTCMAGSALTRECMMGTRWAQLAVARPRVGARDVEKGLSS